MSLRTKLLAAVIGLNGAILLLALYLMLRSEDTTPAPPSPSVILNLAWLGSAAGQEPDELTRARASETLLALETEASLRNVHVVEETGNEPEADYRVWSAREFFSPSGFGDEIEPGPVRDRVLETFKQARMHQNRWAEPDWIAVALPNTMEHGGSRGIVAESHQAPSRRAGVRAVYAVMVLGVIVLTGVSFWLVSRWVIRPLDQLTETVDRIAAGDYRIRLTPRGSGDEFDRTIDAFNRMADEIAEYQGHLEDRVLSALGRMRKAEQHLTVAQRLAATGKLASGVAHEINNPLGGMMNAARALSRGDLPAEKAQQYVELISEGLTRVEETVKKFLSFTPRRVEPRPTDLTEVTRKAVELARHRIERRGVRLDQDLPGPREAMVFGDEHELQQVALNLLLNAADAVSDDGHGRITVRVRLLRDEVQLEIEDNGVGMTPEEQDRCFDLFVTTKEVGEGTGLGLAVVHNIVTNHGGRIEVESAPGEGATFRVLLPAETNGEEAAESQG
ncbi:MAG: sensor histidine kinase [Planctomycetota bacterium]|jgi:signal transduction histidine kinase